MVFHWSLSDSESPQVSRTLLSILIDLNNIAVWMVSTRPLISKSFSSFNNPSVTVPRAPITISIPVTFMFHSFFNSQVRFHFFNFILWSAGTAKSTFLQVLFLFLIIIRSGCLVEIRWPVCMTKSHRSLCVSFSRTDGESCIYHLFSWSNLNFWHNSQCITLPIQSCPSLILFLCKFAAFTYYVINRFVSICK